MLKLSEAADQLGVKPLTLRRWIKSGKLKAHQVQRGAKGFHYEISEEAVDTLQLEHSSADPDPDQDNAMQSSLMDLVTQQTAQIRELQKEKDQLQRDKEVLHGEKEALHRELRAVSETATTFQVKNEMLQEQNDLLQGQVQKLLPPPAEEVEPETPPRRHWYWLWLRAT